MTIKDLARLSGYSVGTVSRALNGLPNVSEQARSAILALAQERGYQLNTNAKYLKQIHSSGIVAVVTGTSNELFAQMIERLSEIAENGSLEELFDTLIEETGYLIHLRAMGDEGINRIENVNELKSNIIKYVEEMEKLPQLSINPENPDEQPEILMPTLAGFLEEVTLYTDIDGYDENADRVIMMTMHSAKGLEFDNVFFCGAEEGIFPGMQAIYNPDQIEEERRLAYVCITRAKKQLYITNAAQRMIFGQTVRNRVSRFVTEIPAGCCDVEDKTIRNASQAELKKASTVKKTRALNDIGVGGMAAARKTTSYSSDAPSGAAAVTHSRQETV